MSKRYKFRVSAAPAEPLVDINTTPLIDVMLVLLIMLIITIPVQLHAVNLNMPVGTPPVQATKPEVVRIDIDARSQVLWNGETLAGPAAVEQHMRQEVAKAVQPEVHLRPDRHARYEVVASILSAAHRSGLTKIGVVGSEQFMQ